MKEKKFHFGEFLRHLRIKKLPAEIPGVYRRGEVTGELQEYTPMHDSFEFIENGADMGRITQPGVTRREFLAKSAMAGTAAGVLLSGVPLVSLVNVASAEGRVTPFRFAVLADPHLQITWAPENHTTARFVQTFERGVAEINQLNPQPDIVFFMGDLAHLGRKEEMELGQRILARLKTKKILQINGEHDWYYDMGAAYEQLFGKLPWALDYNGVHFVAMNNVLTRDYWTDRGWSPQQRMGEMLKLDGKIAGLWGVGQAQLEWLRNHLKAVPKDTPLVVMTHAPLWMYYPNWGFATVEGLSILEMLKPFKSVTCLHGHVHQIVYKEIEHIRSLGMLSTAWPWPYPPVDLPLEMKRMPRSDPGDPFDALGWGKGFVDLVTRGTQYTVYNEYHIFGRPEERYPGAHPTKKYA